MPPQNLFSRKKKNIEKEPELINVDEFIAVKGIKAIGNQLTKNKVKTINLTIPEPEEEEEPITESIEDDENMPNEGTIGTLFGE